MEEGRNDSRNSLVLVSLKRGLNKSNINFIEDDEKYNAEILKGHLRDLKKLKEKVIKKRNESKNIIKRDLDDFLFDHVETNCNFDHFYDNCLEIIQRYLYTYKNLNDIMINGQKKYMQYEKCNIKESVDNNDYNNCGSNNNIQSESYHNDNKELYNMIDNNLFIHNNKFIFDYDDDSEIYTSSEEEIIIDKKIRNNFIKNKNNEDKLNNIRNNLSNNNNDSCNIKLKPKKGKDNNIYKQKKIDLLNRYPIYLRELIKIIKTSKKREKRILQINFFKKNMELADKYNLNKLFHKLYLSNSYENNKIYVEKKKRRILYRMVRYNLLDYIYNNHDILLEKLLIKNKNKLDTSNKNDHHNNVILENVKKLFQSHECNSKSIKGCKKCKENVKLLFYILIQENLNYSPLGEMEKCNNINNNNNNNNSPNLLTHILMKNRDSEIKKKKNKNINEYTNTTIKPINVEYEISYHENMSIYMLSKNNIFCHILHENYIKENFNDLLIRIKNGSIGYNLLHLIFNKYKSANFLNYKKLKRTVENNLKGHINNNNNNNTNNMNPSHPSLHMSNNFFDILKSNITNDENYSSVFFDKLFHNFYDVLYTDKNNYVKENKSLTKKDIEIVNLGEEETDMEDLYHVDEQNNLKHITYNRNITERQSVTINNMRNSINNTRNSISNMRNSINIKNMNSLSLNQIYKNYINIKKITNIDEQFIDDTWDNSNKTASKYHFINKENIHMNDRQFEKINYNSFDTYLNKINNQVAVVVDSDDSDEDVKCNYGKAKNLLNFLKGKSYKTLTDLHRNNIIETYKINHIKKNFILHPLINSKYIGFKINCNDISNRNIDIFCINNNEYVNAYKNTIEYLKNNLSTDIRKNYNDYKNMKNQISSRRKRSISDMEFNNFYNNNNNNNNNNNSKNYINNKNKYNINEYIVIIDENVEEEKYKIDIYNYSELSAYIVNSKEEKKKEYYSNFIRNEIYSHKWINRLQFKLQNYCNLYKNSFFKKKHMKLIKDYLYGIIINSYYENIYDVSLNLLLSNHYNHFDLSKQHVLKNISYNINQIYEQLIKNVRSDILNNQYIKNEYYNITEQNLQIKINEYLLNYRWNSENSKFFDTLIDKYRHILLYYILYTYPKFLYIFNIIKIKHFREEIKLALPEQEDEHVKEAQKDYTSQRKMLRSAKNNQLEINNEETKPFEVDFYLPFYVKNRKDNNILNSFSLQSLLLVGFYESFETPLFSSILYEQTNIETVKNDIHPLCYKMILYFQKNTSFLIKKKLALKQLSILFCILNSYLSFATLQHASFYTQKNLSRFLIFKNSQREINRLNELYSNGNYYFPTNFLHKFLDTFLLKKDNAYIMTEQYKCKLMVYILLIQLCLTDNALPLNLSLINRNTGLILRKLHFSIKDKNIITFNLNE
ncbi:conserved Plasmodium protein, unknown function [Plasmodium sp. gorilla clade G1]|nr:conserved Plasmodium protein, unknown function [Plasmodium sp. gorilla clade G1]